MKTSAFTRRTVRQYVPALRRSSDQALEMYWRNGSRLRDRDGRRITLLAFNEMMRRKRRADRG